MQQSMENDTLVFGELLPDLLAPPHSPLRTAESAQCDGDTVYVASPDGLELGSGAMGPHELDHAWRITDTWVGIGFTLRMRSRMLTGEVSIKNISGPINIAQFAGSSAAAGFNSFMRFLALVSISLGVLNLLPVPVLDGGQIVYQSIEWLKGSPLSDKAQLVGQQLGIVALLLLMSFAFYNDIAKILS